jgi:AcrR family transcriptional regulator
LEVTLQLLEAQGYAAVTTERIAARAKVSKATIYRIWRSKQELVVEAARLRFHALEIPDLGSFRREVEYILESRMSDYRDSGTLTLVAGLVGAASADPLLEHAFESWVHQLDLTLRMIIDRGVKRGDVRSDVAGRTLVSLIAGLVARSVITQRPFGKSDTRALADLIAHAADPTIARPR